MIMYVHEIESLDKMACSLLTAPDVEGVNRLNLSPNVFSPTKIEDRIARQGKHMRCYETALLSLQSVVYWMISYVQHHPTKRHPCTVEPQQFFPLLRRSH